MILDLLGVLQGTAKLQQVWHCADVVQELVRFRADEAMGCSNQDVLVLHNLHCRKMESHNTFEVPGGEASVDEAVIGVDTVILVPPHCDQLERDTVDTMVAQMLKVLAHGNMYDGGNA